MINSRLAPSEARSQSDPCTGPIRVALRSADSVAQWPAVDMYIRNALLPAITCLLLLVGLVNAEGPAGERPLLHALPCPSTCPSPLPALAVADLIVAHIEEHRPGVLCNGLILPSADQRACAHYVVQRPLDRRSSTAAR